jgi:hypothetical protein
MPEEGQMVARTGWLQKFLLPWRILFSSPIYPTSLGLLLFIGWLLRDGVDRHLRDWAYVEDKHHIVVHWNWFDLPVGLLIVAVFFGCLFAVVGYEITLSKIQAKPRHGAYPYLTFACAAFVLATRDLVVPHLISVLMYYGVFRSFNALILKVGAASPDMRAQVSGWKNANTSKCCAYFLFVIICFVVGYSSRNQGSEVHHDLFNMVSGVVLFEMILGSFLYFIQGADWFLTEWNKIPSSKAAPAGA